MTNRYLIDRHSDATGLMARLLEDHEYIVLDCETTGLRPYHGNVIIGLAIYFPSCDESYYVSVRHPVDNVSDHLWRLVLGQLSRHKAVQVGFNYKFDLHFLTVAGMDDPELIEDVQIAAQLLNENEKLTAGTDGPFKLKRLARKYLGGDAANDEKELERVAKARGLNAKTEMWKLEAELVAPYAMADVEITWGLRQHYMKGLEAWGQVEYYQRRNLFVLKALLRMERNGLKVNLDTVHRHMEEIEPVMNGLDTLFQSEMIRLGIKLTDKKDIRNINLNSPAQVKTFLELQGKVVDSTDKDTLEGLSKAGFAWATRLLEYRVLSRANTTYYKPYLEAVTAGGYIHPNLNPIGATTGRLACDHPNFQNIPRGGEKYKVKEVFEPRPGHALLSSDYKQLELRLAVFYACEYTMREMFNNGTDMHQWTADRLGVNRHQGKTANFSFLYGMGAGRGSIKLGTDVPTAKGIINSWHALYPAFKRAMYTWAEVAEEWRDRNGEQGGRFQFIRLFNGRIRHFQEYLKYPMRDSDGNTMPPPYRDAWNAYIQGTAAGVTEESILRTCLAFPDNDVFKPVLTIHDSFVYEIPLEYVNTVVPVIEGIMADWPQFNPALGVDTDYTLTNWFSTEDYTPEAF